MKSERDLKLALVDAKTNSIAFLNTLHKNKKFPATRIQPKLNTVTDLDYSYAAPAVKYASPFLDPNYITELRREHIRTKQANDRGAHCVSVALHILDNLVCLRNPSQLDVDYMHRLALAFIKQAARQNNGFGKFLEGIANLYGYCNPANVATGLKQIQEAAKLKCAEAQHFQGLLYARANFITYCCKMFKSAAKGGHPLAPINYKKAQEALQAKLARARQALNHRQRLEHRRRQRRRREQHYHRTLTLSS